MKKQEKIKALVVNGMHVDNVEQWTQISGACTAVKLKPWNSLNYWVWDKMKQMQSLKEFKSVRERVHF